MQLIKKFKTYILFLAPVVLINCYLVTLPLMDVTGYEISVANSFILFIAAGILTILRQRKKLLRPVKVISDNLSIYLSLALFPLIISLFSNIFLSQCPVTEYAFFYLTGAVPALFLGTICGLISAEISQKSAYGLFFVIFISLIISGFLEIYIFPQIYLYEPVTGYIPGTIYDEDIQVTIKILSYRLINILFWFLTFFVLQLFKIHKKYIKKVIFIFSAVIAIFAFTLIKPLLGFSTSINSLSEELNGKIITKHCEIFFPRDSSPEIVNYLTNQSEYFCWLLSRKLDVNVSSKIKIFAFRDAEQKKNLFGSANADVAKTWSKQIYIETSSINTSLKHELAHIYAAEFGQWPFYMAGALNFGLTEGLAVALENDYGGEDPDYLAFSGFENGNAPNFEMIFNNLSFFDNVSSISYVYAGSLLKYLLENYGTEKLKILYRTGNFKSAYNKTLQEIIPEYRKHLYSKNFIADKKKADVYFSGKSLFNKYCPRIISKKIKEAQKLYSENRLDESYNIFSRIYNKTGDYRSLRGLIFNQMKNGKYTEAIDLINAGQENFKGTAFFDVLQIYKGDLYSLENLSSTADSIYSNVYPEVYESLRDNILKKRKLLEIGTDSLNKYILGKSEERFDLLRKLNSDSLYYYTIPELILRNKQLKNSPEKIFEIFKDVSFNSNNWMEPLYELSVYAKENGDYKQALNFAQTAIEMADRQHLEIYRENKINIEWLIGNNRKYAEYKR